MPSWWGKSWVKEEKTNKAKGSFIDSLHKKFKSPDIMHSRSGGSKRRSRDIVSERGSQSRAVSRSPSPSKHVARCQSFAERSQAHPLPLPGLRTAQIGRTGSGISELAKPKSEKVSKTSLFSPLRRPACIRHPRDPADLDAEHSISSECSVESGDPADSRQYNSLATDNYTAVRSTADSPSRSIVRDQSSDMSATSRESAFPVKLSAYKVVSSVPKRRPLNIQVPNLQVPPHGAFFSAPDSSLSSPSRSPMRVCGYDHVTNSAFPYGKLYPDLLLLGSGQCSSPGSGQTSEHNSMGGDMSGQLFWQHSRGSPEYSPNPSPKMTSPGHSSRIHSGAVTPLHPRAGGGHSESLSNWPDDAKQQSHRLPLPPTTISNRSPFYHANSAVTSPSLPRSPGRAEALTYPGSRWKRGKLLGQGTFGHVYVGFNSETGEMCAMKEVTLFADDAKSKESSKQLGQEIALLSRLKHPNIVQYYGSEMAADRLYIYLEYVSGGSIHKILQDYGKLGESAIRSYTQQILSGLAYLHAKNTVHRDIKGANILVDPNGRVKLADFGMAKHITGQTCPLSFKGSPYWMAPEVIKNSNGCNLAVDIWSLGCTVLEMATSKPPWSQYEGVAAMFKIGNSKELPTIPDHLSEEGKDFVRLCLQRNPQQRLTAAQLLEHPFVKCIVTLEKQFLGSYPSEHSVMTKAVKSTGIGNSRSPQQSDSERLAVHSSRVSKSSFHSSDTCILRNLSCPVSPIGSPLLHHRKPQHLNGWVSPSPISSPLTASGSSTPLSVGIGVIPCYQSMLLHEGYSAGTKRPLTPCAHMLSYRDPDILRGVHSGSLAFQELASCNGDAVGQEFGRVVNGEFYDGQSILADRASQQLLKDPVRLNAAVDLNPSSPFRCHHMAGV